MQNARKDTTKAAFAENSALLVSIDLNRDASCSEQKPGKVEALLVLTLIGEINLSDIGLSGVLL